MCKTGVSIEKTTDKHEIKTEEIIQNQNSSSMTDSVMPVPDEDNVIKEQHSGGMKAEKEWVQKGLKSYSKKNYEFDEKTAAMYRERIDLYAEEIWKWNDRQLIHIPGGSALKASEYKGRFSNRIGDSKRRSKQKNPKSRLYQKNVNYNKLITTLDKFHNRRYKHGLLALKELGGDMEASDFNDVTKFLTWRDQTKNTELMKIFCMNRDEEGNISRQGAAMGLVKMADQLLNFDVSLVHLESDTEMVKNATRLETLTCQLAAFDRLARKYDFFESLSQDKKRAILLKLDSLRDIAAYYTVRKELITNPLYRTRYNDELSMDVGKARTEEEKTVARLLIKSFVLGKKLMENGHASQNAIRNLGRPVIETDAGQDALTTTTSALDSVYATQNISSIISESYKKSDLKAADKLESLRDQRENEKIDSLIRMNDSATMLNDQESRQDKKEKTTGFAEHELRTLLTSDELTPLKETRVMADLRHDIQAIQALMGEKMPPVKFDINGDPDTENEKKAREAIDSACIVIVMLYKRLSESIDKVNQKYGKTYPELCAMLREFGDNCNKERDSFREKALEFRSHMLQDPGFAEGKETWIDALRYERGVFYDLDNNNELQVQRLGEGTSIVYAIKNKSDSEDDIAANPETVFFRKKDVVPPKNDKLLIKGVLDEINLSEETLKNVKTFIALVRSNVNTANAFTKIIERAKERRYPYGLIADTILQSFKPKDKHGIPMEIPNEERDKFGQAMVELASAFAKRTVAMQTSRSPKIGEGRNLSDRNVATSRLATMLGIQSLICDSRNAVIKKDGKLIEGNLMEGTGSKDTFDMRMPYSMNAVSQIFQLEIFDYICGQIDRHIGNFHGIVKDGKIVAIKAIDNDMSFGLLSSKDLRDAHAEDYGYNYLRPLTVSLLMGIPTSFANRIMALNREYIDQVLGDILNKEELDALEDRLNMIKDKISRLPKMEGAKNAVWDKKTKQLSYKGEDADEELRQLKCIKGLDLEARLAGKNIYDRSCFNPYCLNAMGKIDELIKDRKDELDGN